MEHKKTINAIFAVSDNDVIGVNNSLPWALSADLRFFKKQTERNIVIMGRCTYLSMNAKPLPNRINVIITTKRDEIESTFLNNENIFTFKTINEALEYFSSFIYNKKDIYLIGGKGILHEAFNNNYIDNYYVTHVKTKVKYEHNDIITLINPPQLNKFTRTLLSSNFDNDLAFDIVKYAKQ